MQKVNLTQGYYAVIDDNDFEKISQYNWHVNIQRGGKNLYACTNKKGCPGKKIYMHHLVMNSFDKEIDHINGNGLDNRKSNLRIVTHSQNHMNKWKPDKKTTSKYKGVHYRNGKWAAAIKIKKKRIWIGTFSSEKEAALAYNESAIKYHADFARLNTID